MCLIAIKTRGARLSEDEIRYDFRTNPHGAGFMYTDDRSRIVRWEKGFFSVDDLIKRWKKVVKDDMVAVLHTRIATHGAHSAALCHPFPLDGSDMFRSIGSAPLVMMHNGIIPDRSWKQWETKGDSDTSAYARKLTPLLDGKLPDNQILRRIEDEGGWSRFVFLNGDGDYVTAGEWHEDGGILFSHSGFWANRQPWYNTTAYSTPAVSSWDFSSSGYQPRHEEEETERYRALFGGYETDWDKVDDRARRMGLEPLEDVWSYGDLAGSYSSDRHYYVNLLSSLNSACDVYSYCEEDDGFDYERGVVFRLDENYAE